MNISTVLTGLVTKAKLHSPVILVGAGIVGFAFTAYTAYKASPRINLLIDEKTAEKGEDLTKKEEAKVIFKHLWPTLLIGLLSAICIVGSNFIMTKRNAVLGSAVALANQKLATYQEEVLKTVGEEKHREIREKVTEKQMKETPVPKEDKTMIINSENKELFYDCFSGRYFYSTMQAVREAVIRFNEELLEGTYMCVNDFYSELDIPQLDHEIGDCMGFEINIDGRLDPSYNAKITEDGRPCILIDYTPKPHFGRFC